MAHSLRVDASVASECCCNSHSPASSLDTPLERIKSRLHRDKFVRLCLEFMERYADAHLKFLIVDELSDRRRMRVGDHEVWNFGCDSFLGLDRDRRVQQAMVEALPRFGAHNGASRAFSSVTL